MPSVGEYLLSASKKVSRDKKSVVSGKML
jgi:hypothetical protein